MAGPEYDLGPAELEVLKVLWEEGPGPVRTVMNALHKRGRKIAYTTVQTMLTRLEQKQFVRSDKRGLAYVYKPAISREKISRSRLRTLLEQLYDGAAGPLVLQLVKTERLAPDELAQLQQLIEKLDTDS